MNSINSLTLVEAPAINYRQKFVDRTHLKALYESRGQADDILIIKNGWVTDSYYCNVVFARGEQLLTPSYPLLEGTKRALLLEKGQIKSYPITASMIRQFDSIYLINAMIELGACQVPITNISGL
ncbi:MAG: aminotransferase class IV [Bacteroidota bacterium]